jgi:hypothetical protein
MPRAVAQIGNPPPPLASNGAEQGNTVISKTPLIIMVGADKGGVGKTTVARAIDGYLQSKRVSRKIFDSEYPKGVLTQFTSGCDVVDIQNVDDQMRVFDSINGVTLLDIRAGQLSPTLDALNEVGLLNDVRSGKLALALLHVIGPSVASLREISETSAAIGGGARHFLVKNYATKGGFAEWEKDERFASAFKTAESHTITIPHLIDRAYVEVELTSKSFDAFASDPEGSTMLAGYVRSWLAKAFAEFERVKLGELVDGAA